MLQILRLFWICFCLWRGSALKVKKMKFELQSKKKNKFPSTPMKRAAFIGMQNTYPKQFLFLL